MGRTFTLHLSSVCSHLWVGLKYRLLMRAIKAIKMKKMKFVEHMKHIHSGPDIRLRSRDVIDQRVCENKIHQTKAKLRFNHNVQLV